MLELIVAMEAIVNRKVSDDEWLQFFTLSLNVSCRVINLGVISHNVDEVYLDSLAIKPRFMGCIYNADITISITAEA
jgi:hypothetical protein